MARWPGGLTALGHAAAAGGQGDQRHALQFVAQGAPGVAMAHTGRGYTPSLAADHVLRGQRPPSALRVPTSCGTPARR
jgi:hypothetical protein